MPVSAEDGTIMVNYIKERNILGTIWKYIEPYMEPKIIPFDHWEWSLSIAILQCLLLHHICKELFLQYSFVILSIKENPKICLAIKVFLARWLN